MVDKVKVGLMGVGNIAPQYIKWSRTFDILDVVACADLDPTRAKSFAEENDLRGLTVDEMLADPEIELIINLTVPLVHADVSTRILQAGKHVHSEKPLGVTRAEGASLLALAEQKGLLVGCAPDTFLGGGLQTCRKLIDDGAIGEPIGASAFFMGHGPESWHPNPDFFYKFGAGPMFDVGPYYVTALVHLLGPIKSVSAATRISFPKRIATSPALNGHEIEVEVPTHYSGSLNFVSGPIGTMIASFDVWKSAVPRIEIYGSEGTLNVPDPNIFAGPVNLWTTETKEWQEVPLTHSAEVGRGIGAADLAYAIRTGRPARASGALAQHVVDVMQSFTESSDQGQTIIIGSTVEQPAPLPLNLPAGQLDG